MLLLASSMVRAGPEISTESKAAEIAALVNNGIPALKAHVTDLTQTLNPAEQSALEAKLTALETEKGSQIGVLIVPTTQPETIEQYAIRVASQWKLGRAQQDDGVLLLVAKNDRKLRIEVGYGLEGAILMCTPSALFQILFRHNSNRAIITAALTLGLINSLPWCGVKI